MLFRLSVGSNINKSKKAKFLEKHFPFVQEVILVSGKFFDKNILTTGGIMVDDHEKNLQNSHAENILFFDRGEREFNMNCNENTRSAENWKEVYNLIMELL